jgi:hypothetical protein
MADSDQICGGKSVPDLLALMPLLNVVRRLLARRTENVFDITGGSHKRKFLMITNFYSMQSIPNTDNGKPKTNVRR